MVEVRLGRWAAVVVTYERPDSVRRTVAALLSQSVRPDRIVVVDNAGDESPIDGASLVQASGNIGYAGGLALGCQHLPEGAEFVLFADDDSVTPPDTVERLLSVACSDKRIGVVGTRGGLIRWGRPRHGEARRVVDSPDAPTVCDVDFAFVDHALVRRSALEQVGPPDVELFMAMEDIEFTTRVGDAGWRVVTVDAEVHREHLGSTSSWRLYYQVRNHALIARKRRSAVWWCGWIRRTAGMLIASLVIVRDPERFRLRLRGAVDGLRGITDRRVGPN